MTKISKAKSIPTKTSEININKIGVFFKRSILKDILKILTMNDSTYRTFKCVKNINRLFANIDVSKYKSQELESYIWCIASISKKWCDGYTNIDVIHEVLMREDGYDNIKENIIEKTLEDPNIISALDAKSTLDLVSEALQYGYITSVKDSYIELLDEISLDKPGSFKEVVNRLFMISKSLLDIQHNTNLISNKIQFNTADFDSIRDAINQTITSLSKSNNMLKTGITRWNTLLSPAYMNGRLYVYAGPPGSGKSVILLKSALDIRKYNPDFVPKTKGMRPAVLYITMENTFIETIERIWSMTFDDSITNHSEEEALDMLCKELGISKVLKDDVKLKDLDTGESLSASLEKINDDGKTNIEIVMQYYPYRDISTDDLFTIIQDLRDEGLEVCALVFDYIKRIRPANAQADNVKLELNRIINELKALAVILDIPVITAHQLNRTAAAIIDNATRQGRTDGLKQTGREHIGDAYEVVETADWLCLCNILYKPGTDRKYFEMNVVKRRRIDMNEAEFAKFTYLAHPFSKNNGLRLIDDINSGKILSLQSLSSDIDMINKEQVNAVPRFNPITQEDFVDD